MRQTFLIYLSLLIYLHKSENVSRLTAYLQNSLWIWLLYFCMNFIVLILFKFIYISVMFYQKNWCKGKQSDRYVQCNYKLPHTCISTKYLASMLFSYRTLKHFRKSASGGIYHSNQDTNWKEPLKYLTSSEGTHIFFDITRTNSFSKTKITFDWKKLTFEIADLVNMLWSY